MLLYILTVLNAFHYLVLNTNINMSGDEKMDPEEGNHENFLVSMSKIGKSDGRFRLQHKNDETQVLNQPLSELMGENVTIENLLQPVSGKTTQDGDSTTTNKNQLQKDFKKSYEKSVNKNQNLRLAAPASSVQEGRSIEPSIYFMSIKLGKSSPKENLLLLYL